MKPAASLETFIGSSRDAMRPASSPDGAGRTPSRGRPLVYMPLSAFGLYNGEVLVAREDGSVDVGLYRYCRRDSADRFIDLELSRIEVVASRETMRPGTCFLLDPHADAVP